MTTVYTNPWFSVIQEGRYHYIRETGAHNGAVVLVRSARGFIFVEVHRLANQGVFIEAPRGYGDAGETARQCAVRELREETGFDVQAERLVELGQVQPNSALLASSVTAFFVDVGNQTPKAATDGEVERLVTIPVDELPSALANGRLVDGFALSALALYWARHQEA